MALWTDVECVFLDRDGVILRKLPEGQYLTDWRHAQFLAGALTALRMLHERGKTVIVATNQRGVALKLMSRSKLDRIHQKLRHDVALAGGKIDRIYSCVHDIGECDCRKPETGLLTQAFRDFPQCKPANSVMIGDSLSDIEAGSKLGLRTIFIEGDAHTEKPGAELARCQSTCVASSLYSAACSLCVTVHSSSEPPPNILLTMHEASKTKSVRSPEFYSKYFAGKVLDIGCGPDLVVPHAQPFDREHGDANYITRYFPKESFDCVHSSHCLEHMQNPEECLQQWWSLVKPGGYLITVVPDEELYEQGYWPSLFNPDHKATFRLQGPAGSPVSRNLQQLVEHLPGALVISAERQDRGYVHCNVTGKAGKVTSGVLFKLHSVLSRSGMLGTRFGRIVTRLARRHNVAVDQTLGSALAQIQIVAVKEPVQAQGYNS